MSIRSLVGPVLVTLALLGLVRLPCLIVRPPTAAATSATEPSQRHAVPCHGTPASDEAPTGPQSGAPCSHCGNVVNGLPQPALHADAPLADLSLLLLPVTVEDVSLPRAHGLRFAIAAPRPPDSFALTSVRLL